MSWKSALHSTALGELALSLRVLCDQEGVWDREKLLSYILYLIGHHTGVRCRKIASKRVFIKIVKEGLFYLRFFFSRLFRS